MQEQNLQSSKNEQNLGNGSEKLDRGNAGRSGSESSFGSTSMDAGKLLDAAKSTSMDLLEKAKSTAGEAYGTVAEKATSKLEEGKVGLSGGLSSVADSIRKVAGGLHESTESNTISDYSAKYADSAAQKLEDAASYFETQDLAAITRDVESFARRNTVMFLGAAFALGILAARFFKSSPSAEIHEFETPKLGNVGGNTPALPDPGLTSSARGV